MADRLEILIIAKDQASAVISTLGNQFSTLGKYGLAAAGAGLAALGAGLAISIKEAMSFEEVFAQTNAVIQSTGGVAGVTTQNVWDLASSLSQVTKYGEEDVAMGENLLLTFTGIGKDIFPAATETMLDMSTALGQDLKSSAIQLGKALQDPVLGVTALRRVGVNFTEDQQTMIKAMVDAGDTAGAQAFIMKELQREFGGSAKAAGETLAGKLTILKNRLLEVGEGIGVRLLPIALDFLNKFIVPMLPKIEEFAGKLADVATAIFSTGINSDETKTALQGMFGEELGTTISGIITFFTDLGTTIGNFVTNTVIPFVSEHAEAFKGALIAIGAVLLAATIVTGITSIVTALSALMSPIGLIVIAVGLLGAAWATNFLGIRDALTNVWNFLQPIFASVVQWLQTNIPIAIQAVTGFWNNTLMPALRAVWSFIQTYIIPVFVLVGQIVGTVVSLAVQVLAGVWTNYLMPAITAVWNFLKEKLQPVFEALQPIIQVIFVGALNAMKLAFDGVKEAIRWVIEKLQAFKSWLDKIKIPSWLQRKSPSEFEMTFIGANKAIKELARANLPTLQMRLSAMPRDAILGGFGGVGANNYSTRSFATTINIQPGAIVIQGSGSAKETAAELLNQLGSLAREQQIGVA